MTDDHPGRKIPRANDPGPPSFLLMLILTLVVLLIYATVKGMVTTFI